MKEIYSTIIADILSSAVLDFMLVFLRPSNLFLLVTYLALSVVPVITTFASGGIASPARIIGMSIAAWIAIWAVFKRPAWFHWLLLPAFVTFPIELYLHAYYGQGLSLHHLGIIAETSPTESLEFLGDRFWMLPAVVLVISAWFCLSWRAALHTRDLDWTGQSRWLAAGLLATVFVVYLYDREASAQRVSSAPLQKMIRNIDPSFQAQNYSATLPQLPSWAKIPVYAEAFEKTWPFGLTVQVHNFWKERAYLSGLKEKSKSFNFGAYQAAHQKDLPQILVLVIGESSRYDRWSLNGYARDTNPLLKAEPNVVSLSDVITAVSATRLSVPVLMSRKPAMQSLQAGFYEKSFLSAFKEAGFKTYWLSNQMSFGKFDTPVSVFADEADVTQFVNLGGAADKSNYDEVLLRPLKSAIANSAKKKLIVLHTLGNHWNYSHRHPEDFNRWQPSLSGVANPVFTDLRLKTQLNNSYDNSILYTDWFLAQVIGALEGTRQVSAMMYISDHGQSLYDGSCTLAFHGHNTQYDFHVPALIWYSDPYKSAQPEKINQLLRHRHAPLATENIFHSMLDMADIRYGTEQLERSFFHMTFRKQKRYVDSYGWTDYDNAEFKGDCREVIGKSKPLPRIR